MASWRDDETVVRFLRAQGYLDATDKVLQMPKLLSVLTDLWLAHEVVKDDPAEVHRKAITKDELVELMFPGFAGTVFSRPMDPMSEEYEAAVTTYAILVKMVWNDASKLTSDGPIQGRLAEKGVLLCEWRVQRDPEPARPQPARFCTSQSDAVMKYYVDPRATKLQRTVNHLHDDLELGQRAIPEIAERMRKEFGVAVDVAVMKLARVSEPTVVAIGGSDTVKEIEGGKSNRKKS